MTGERQSCPLHCALHCVLNAHGEGAAAFSPACKMRFSMRTVFIEIELFLGLPAIERMKVY